MLLRLSGSSSWFFSVQAFAALVLRSDFFLSVNESAALSGESQKTGIVAASF